MRRSPRSSADPDADDILPGGPGVGDELSEVAIPLSHGEVGAGIEGGQAQIVLVEGPHVTEARLCFELKRTVGLVCVVFDRLEAEVLGWRGPVDFGPASAEGGVVLG